MARKKKKKNRRPLSEHFADLKQEALRGVAGIFLFAIATLLLLAAFNAAGVGGSFVYNSLKGFFGVGYFLLPVLAVVLGISLIRSIENQVSSVRYISAFLFTLGALGILEILSERAGGLVGYFIAAPLLSLFEVYATLLLLGAITVGALIIALNMTPSLEGLRNPLKRSAGDEETVITSGFDDVEDEDDYEEEEEDYDEEEDVEEEYEDEEEPKGAIPTIHAFGPYEPPPLSLLEKDRGKPGVGDVKANANLIKRTLQNFGISVEIDEVSIGPTVTRYALKPAEGVRLSKIVALQNNLELALAAHPIRIEAPIPGKSLVGIEVPNTAKTTIGLGSLLSQADFTESDKPLLIALGKDITGTAHFADVAKMPHTLIAGATGSGKSVMINNLVISLLYRCGPEELRFVMVDPKRVELTPYNNIPHLLTPVITDAKKAIMALKWLTKEMERRYDLLETEQVRDISSYHENIYYPALEKNVDPEKMPESMPYIVLIIDELADIMQAYPRELEAGIVRLAQMSRAVGIHLVLSTQRPSVQIITGLIKANVPARVALQVASQIDSRTILDMSGAEKLLGAGDMLFLSADMSKPRRMQSAYISEGEVKKVSGYLQKKYRDQIEHVLDFSEVKSGDSTIFGGNGEDDDDLYDDAYNIVVEARKASTSLIQRKLRVGYARAARLMDMLEERGVIGPQDGAKPREVLAGHSADGFGEADEEEDDEHNEHER